jgi:hypothetical protein
LVTALSAAAIVGSLFVGVIAAPAAADPVNAKGAALGTADCGTGGTFTFVVNSGVGNGNGSPWNPALAVSTSGARAVFVPTELHLTFTSPQGSFSFDATKGATQGSVVCSVQGQAVNAPFSFVGTAIGNIVTRGPS